MELSRRQWTLVGFFFTVNFLCSVIYTLQQPFYPKLAESKNASATEFSLVFGVYEAAVVVSCPLWSSLVYVTGVKRAFVGGVVVQGASVVAFGFVDRILALDLFLFISILIRVAEAFSCSAAFVAMYTLIPLEFPKYVPMIMATIQMGQAIGYSVGPPIGGALYMVGGFSVPFMVVGVLNVFLGVMLPFVIWLTPEPLQPTQKQSALTILKDPAILVNFVMLLGVQVAMAFNYTLWTPFLTHTFDTGPVAVGLVFGLSGLLYAVPLPLWGRLVTKVNPVYVVVLGLLLDIPGNVLIGPLPLFNWTPSFVGTCVGIGLAAAGTGAALIGGFVTALNTASGDEVRERSQTMSLVSGCYLGFFADAFSVGSPIAGLLYDNYGFQGGAFFSVGLLLISLVIAVFYMWRFSWKVKRKSAIPASAKETSRLLDWSGVTYDNL